MYNGLEFSLLSNQKEYQVKMKKGFEFADSHLVIPHEYNGKPVVALASHAFWGSSNAIKSIDLPYTLKEIKAWALSLGSLEKIKIPPSVTKLGEGAFQGAGIIEIELPDSITKITNGVFSSCGKLKRIKFGNAVTSIGTDAFRWCKSLEEIDIPASVEKFGRMAFLFNSLRRINVDPNSEHFVSVDGVLYTKDMATLICYPANKDDTDRYVAPETLTSIENMGCCDALKYVELTSNVKKIATNGLIHNKIEEITLSAELAKKIKYQIEKIPKITKI